MGIRTSSIVCCCPEQRSINLNLSTDTSIKQMLDDEALIYSINASSSNSSKYEKLNAQFKSFSNEICLHKQEIQEFPCLLQLSTPNVEIRQGLDIVFVIDLSSSMTNPWLSVVKKCLKHGLSQLSNRDRVSIIGFSDIAVKLCPLSIITPQSKIKIFNSIKNIEGSGGSNLLEGLNIALQVLSNRRMCNVISTLMLFTRSKQNIEKIKELLNSYAISTNIYINAFGLGEHSTETLSSLCTESEGNYYNIPHPISLSQAFVSCLGEVISIYAEDIKVSVDLIASSIPISLEKVYMSQSYVISGRTSEICVILNVMPCAQLAEQASPLKILKVFLSYKLSVNSEEIRENFILELPVNVGKLNGGEINIDAALHMYRYRFADLLYEVLFENSLQASMMISEFVKEVQNLEDLPWVIILKEEAKNYEKILKMGWNDAIKARIVCSMKGFMNKSLFYVDDFQNPVQKDQARLYKT